MKNTWKFTAAMFIAVGAIICADAAAKKRGGSVSEDGPGISAFSAEDYSQDIFNKRVHAYFGENDLYGLSQYLNGHEIGRTFIKKQGKEMGALVENHWKNMLQKKDYLGLEKFMYACMGSRRYTPVLFTIDKEREREDWTKIREVQRLLMQFDVERQVNQWQRDLRELRSEIVAWQSQKKAAELEAEKGREEAWIAKHEKEYKAKVEPIVEEMEYAEAIKKFNEMIAVDKSTDASCVAWANAKAAKIEALWAEDLNKNLRARVKEMEEDKKTTEDIVMYVMSYGNDALLSNKVSKLLQAEKMGLINRLGGKFDEAFVLKEIIKQIDDEVSKIEAGTEDGARIRTYQRYLKMINAGRLSKIGSEDKNAKVAMAVALERGHYFVADKLISLNKDVYDPQQVVWSPDAVEWCMTNQLDICRNAFDKITESDENSISVKCLNSMLRYTRKIEDKEWVLVHWFSTDYGERHWGCGELCRYLITKLSRDRKEVFLHNAIAFGGFFSFSWMLRPCSYDRFAKMVEMKSISEKFFKMDSAASYLTCTIAYMQQNRDGSITREDGLKTIKLLLDKGAPLNVKVNTLVPSASGRIAIVREVTPLQFAVMIGDKEVVELLLQPEWGANVGEKICLRCSDVNCREGSARYTRAKSILELCRKPPVDDYENFSSGMYFTQSQEDRVKIEKLLIDAGASE